MSFIRSGSNPEALYVVHNVSNTVDIWHGLKYPLCNKGKTYINLPAKPFLGACRRWAMKHYPGDGRKVEYRGVTIEEKMIFLKTGKDIPDSWYDEFHGKGRSLYQKIMALTYNWFITKDAEKWLHDAAEAARERLKNPKKKDPPQTIFMCLWDQISYWHRKAHPIETLIKFSYKDQYFYAWEVTFQHMTDRFDRWHSCYLCRYKNPQRHEKYFNSEKMLEAQKALASIRVLTPKEAIKELKEETPE